VLGMTIMHAVRGRQTIWLLLLLLFI